MTQGWTTLDALRPGTIFETDQGLRYVKQDRAQLTDAESVVFLGDGSVEHFEPGTRVMPVPLPPVRPMSVDMDEPVHAWFELTYAQYLTIPRSLLESMPVSWQRDFVDRLEELEATFDWRPREGRYWVRLKDEQGRFVEDRLMHYRHPDYAYIDGLRKTT